MAGEAYRYSPYMITLSVHNRPIDAGLGEDEFLTIELSEDDAMMTTGVLGDVMISATFKRHAEANITLLAGSPANDILQDLRDAGVRSDNGVAVGPFDVRDMLGRSVHKAAACFIAKPPPVTYGRGPGERVWKIGILHLETYNGGNISAV